MATDLGPPPQTPPQTPPQHIENSSDENVSAQTHTQDNISPTRKYRIDTFLALEEDEREKVMQLTSILNKLGCPLRHTMNSPKYQETVP